MSQFWALTWRELRALWFSPIGSVIGALFLFAQGFVYWMLVMVLNDPRIDPSWNMARLFFGNFFYWLTLFIAIPILTMRTFSEEKRTGSIELLMTAPLTETQIVLSKFFAAWIAYALLWLATVIYFVVLQLFAPFDWGPVLAGYFGTIAMGGMLISLGVLASSLTRNQVISGLLGFVFVMVSFAIGLLTVFITDPSTQEFVRTFAIAEHISQFAKGFVDTRPLVLYASITAIALLLTGRVIGNPRWRT